MRSCSRSSMQFCRAIWTDTRLSRACARRCASALSSSTQIRTRRARRAPRARAGSCGRGAAEGIRRCPRCEHPCSSKNSIQLTYVHIETGMSSSPLFSDGSSWLSARWRTPIISSRSFSPSPIGVSVVAPDRMYPFADCDQDERSQ